MAPGYQVVTSKPSIFAIFCSTTTFITSSKIILLFHLLPVLLPPIDESDQYPVRFLLQWNPARNISNQLSTHFIQLFLSWMLLPPAPSPLLSPACRATACWMRCSLRSVSLVLLFILNLVQCCLSIICRLTHVNNTCDVNTSGIGCYPTELTFLRPFCSTILRKENSSACSATKTFWCENDNHLALHEPLATANGVASIERTCVHAMML